MHRPIEQHDGKPEECRRCHPRLALADQAAFVTQWRKDHALGVYGPWWQCPLCDHVIQSAMPEADLAANVKRHQEIVHGADWTAYMALGDTP